MDFISILNFNGINRQVSPFLIEIGELAEAQNLVTDKIGVLRKSFDYTVKGSRIANNLSVYGAVDFYRTDGTHDHIVAVNGASNAEIYLYDSDWTTQSQSLTKDYRVRFAYSPTIDTLLAVNFADATRSFDGTSWSTSTNVTNAPKAYYIISWGDRFYLLNCDVSGTSYPSRAYRSDAIETSVTWDSDEYIVFNDTITGVGTNGENLFVTCQNSTHVFTLNEDKYKVSDIGCTSHESIVNYATFSFYASRDGYYAFDGKDTFKISSAIEDFWKNIPEANFSSIQAVVHQEHIYVYVGDITAPWDSTETLQNVIFDYNILQNNWNRGQLGNDCTSLHTFVTSSGKKVFMGDDTAFVYQMFDNSGQQNTADYSSHFETDWVYGSGASIYDDYYEVHAFGKYLSGLKVFYKTSETSSWKSAGELNGERDVVKLKRVRSDKIRFRFAENSGQNLYEVYRVDVGYEPVYEENEDRTR